MSKDLSPFKISGIFWSPFFCFLISWFLFPDFLSHPLSLFPIPLPPPPPSSFFLSPSLHFSSPDKKEALKLFVSLQKKNKCGKMISLWLSKNKEQTVQTFLPTYPVWKGLTCLEKEKEKLGILKRSMVYCLPVTFFTFHILTINSTAHSVCRQQIFQVTGCHRSL